MGYYFGSDFVSCFGSSLPRNSALLITGGTITYGSITCGAGSYITVMDTKVVISDENNNEIGTIYYNEYKRLSAVIFNGVTVAAELNGIKVKNVMPFDTVSDYDFGQSTEPFGKGFFKQLFASESFKLGNYYLKDYTHFYTPYGTDSVYLDDWNEGVGCFGVAVGGNRSAFYPSTYSTTHRCLTIHVGSSDHQGQYKVWLITSSNNANGVTFDSDTFASGDTITIDFSSAIRFSYAIFYSRLS